MFHLLNMYTLKCESNNIYLPVHVAPNMCSKINLTSYPEYPTQCLFQTYSFVYLDLLLHVHLHCMNLLAVCLS